MKHMRDSAHNLVTYSQCRTCLAIICYTLAQIVAASKIGALYTKITCASIVSSLAICALQHDNGESHHHQHHHHQHNHHQHNHVWDLHAWCPHMQLLHLANCIIWHHTTAHHSTPQHTLLSPCLIPCPSCMPGPLQLQIPFPAFENDQMIKQRGDPANK